MNSNSQSTRDAFNRLPGLARAALMSYFRTHLPVRHYDARLDLIDDEYRDVILEVMDSLCTSKPKGLLLAGEKGVGKTSTMYVILKLYLMHQYLSTLRATEEDGGTADVDAALRRLPARYVFVSQFELVRQLREFYSGTNHDQGTPAVITRPLVFIDDIEYGHSDQAHWNLVLLNEYFDERWRNEKLVFVNTNKQPEELRTWPGWSRIIDRLLDPTWMRKVWVSGNTKRSDEFNERRAAAPPQPETSEGQVT